MKTVKYLLIKSVCLTALTLLFIGGCTSSSQSNSSLTTSFLVSDSLDDNIETYLAAQKKIDPKICADLADLESRYGVNCPDSVCISCNTDISISSHVIEDRIIAYIYCAEEIGEKVVCLDLVEDNILDSIRYKESVILKYNECCPYPVSYRDRKNQILNHQRDLDRAKFITNYLYMKLNIVNELITYLGIKN